MIIDIENIGIIEKASIELNGLTVIAGNNDSGKSTVGKIAYSLTKAFEDFEKNYEKEKFSKLRQFYREFFILFRRNVELRKYPELEQFINNFSHYRQVNNQKLYELIKQSKDLLDKKIQLKPESKERIDAAFNEINTLFQEKKSRKALIIESLQAIFKSEFQNQINNISSSLGKIDVSEGKNKLIEILIANNKIIGDKTKIIDEIFPFSSSFLIETPFILTYKEDLELSDNYHVKDLLNKLETTVIKDEKSLLNISKIISGNVYFDEEEDNFLFNKNVSGKKVKIKISNSASGIRSLGILQILENLGEFNKDLLLIIDEPEVHLHPDWQVEYAKLLIELVKGKVKVLIASHSPYLIEALDKYSKEAKIENRVKFYLSEVQQSGKAIIFDKTDNKDEIFDKLSKPFERLIFGD